LWSKRSSTARERQFALFKTWATRRQQKLWESLADRYVLYGEWLYAKHTIFYEALPHYFFEVDLLDAETGEFLLLAANCASIALVCAPRTMRESALFMSKPGPQRWPNGIARVSLVFRPKSSTGCLHDGNRLI